MNQALHAHMNNKRKMKKKKRNGHAEINKCELILEIPITEKTTEQWAKPNRF
jgi:hypothetical protein